MALAIPRLRHRVEPGRPRPRWVDVESLDLTRHLVERDLGGTRQVSDVQTFLQQRVREAFERSRSQ